LQRFLRSLLLRDILDREENPIRAFPLLIDPAGIENHRSPADPRELMLNLETIEMGILRDNFFQQLSQRRNIPLVVAYLKDIFFPCHLRRHPEGLVEGIIRGDYF
jgi:hypothetical protein